MSQKELTAAISKYRKDNQVFQKSVTQRSEKNQIITYDGPPFASGSPHFGHGLTSTMKDAIGRYKTMQGYRVVRNRGRDCHGLPVEKYVEKLLGIDGKKDIEKMGVEKFVEACRESVRNTNDEWKRFVDNLGRRADMDHAYFTMDLDFMESVMRVFQNMYNRNLVYKGFKIQGYCPSCATGLSNSEISDGYKDRQDPAITIKFPLYIKELKDKEEYETTAFDYVKGAKGIIKDNSGKILMLYHAKFDAFIFPGGRIDKGETAEITLAREFKEELGVELKSSKLLGSENVVLRGQKKVWFHSFFDVEIEGTPTNLESDKHTQMVRAEIIDADNNLGFAINIEGTIIDDEEEIITKFNALYNYKINAVGEIGNEENKAINILAWTTTPWTLPSNMFLATGKNIKYAIVFDKESKEYYLLANDLVKNYYKNPETYILINIIDGNTLKGFSYKPLFDCIPASTMADEYKDNVFQVINGDFVSLESGTGVVHLAPAFGVDDFEAVAQIFPREKAKDWLFLPVDEYGEFTDEVPEYKGIRVFDTNKEVIRKLKDENKLIYQTSYEHSYPHCWRCDTPLIYKAMEAWFIKENEISADSIKNLDQINFVPETVKNRFADVLKTAPDRNISRNRYRGAPLPIWESIKNPENRMVVGNLEELFQLTQTGSNNITKNIFIRHAKTDYNDLDKHDFYGKAALSTQGKEQAKKLADELDAKIDLNDEFVIVLSPLKRTLETIKPFLSTMYEEEQIADIEKKYEEITAKYKKLVDEGTIMQYVQDATECFFEINDKIFLDFRITDIISYELQDNPCSGHTRAQPIDQKMTPKGESIVDNIKRTASYLEFVNQKFKSKTIITVSHKDAVTLMIKRLREFDYLTQKDMFSPTNCEVKIYYRDNERNTEIDLHKPYIDNYRFEVDGEKFVRIPDVLDCWFESGAMPYGQANFTGTERLHAGANDTFSPLKLRGKLPYPADYIIEGLDQTRGWFRTLHVLGNGVMGGNSFKNVVINGLVLAEDGKKMAKKLKNYPDPAYLFDKYGSDSYRLYLLNSPAVRAEPVRFTEKGVEQVFKDYNSALNNTYKFFETYAKVDDYKFSDAEVFFIRHAEAEGEEKEANLTQNGMLGLQDKDFIQEIIKINPDVIYVTDFKRTQETAQTIVDITKEYNNKDVAIKIEAGMGLMEGDNVEASYTKILQETNGTAKRVLIVGHFFTFKKIWNKYYNLGDESTKIHIDNLDIVQVPTWKIASETDKWILSELNNMTTELQKYMEKYQLDSAAKLVLGFIDKLNNRYIRRSRRRFRGSGMDDDKLSAYSTLYTVLEKYLLISAPFAPFIAEDIRQKLNIFRGTAKDSIHLENFPIASAHYINKKLIEEVDLVRRIISLGLFVRAKNKVKIKQPLQKMEVRI